MKLTEIYQTKLELAKQWGLAGDAAQEYQERLRCMQNVLQHQEDASAIAHCIARWGDQGIERLDVEALWREAATLPWQYHNPWHVGLILVQKTVTVKT